MRDEKKTKEQLISELAHLRQQIAELQKSEVERKRLEQTLLEETQHLEQKVRELTALNNLFQTHLRQRYQTEQAYLTLVEGLKRLAAEAEARHDSHLEPTTDSTESQH